MQSGGSLEGETWKIQIFLQDCALALTLNFRRVGNMFAKRCWSLGLLLLELQLVCIGTGGGQGKLMQPDAKRLPNVFMFHDTCNVYVIRDGDAALLIDLGDGSVLDHLAEIGVNKVEWVLFTHHHREQCQGYPKLKPWNAKVGAPEAERALFERPVDFRKVNVRLGDAYTIHGASYVRPSMNPIKVDRGFKPMDLFSWRDYEFWCVDTRGNSPGAMSYMLQKEGRWYGFTGDVMLEGAQMHTWFDTEWDYGFAAGIWAMANSAAQVAGYRPELLLPSHGPVVRSPVKQLEKYEEKLFRLEKLLVRGYPVNSFASAVQDKVSRPTAVPHVWQISPHLFKFRGPNFFPNFYLIMSESGHGLAVDCGLLTTNFLESALQGMQQKLGLKQIDAVIPTHMHGDHFLQAPYLNEQWGAQLWAIERMVPVCERPEEFDYSAPIQAYNIGVDRVQYDLVYKEGEKFKWQEYEFTMDWMPGQTEFALCVQGKIDGRLVAFTGDNIFGDPDDPEETGHEAMVAHNSAILEEGYIYGAEYLKKLKPDLLAGGHSYVMDKPAKFVERYRKWAYQMRDAFRELSSDKDYEYWFDPFWVRAEPYRVRIAPGEETEIQLHVRNFRSRTQKHEIAIHLPEGFSAEPAILTGSVPAESRAIFRYKLKAAENAPKGAAIVAFDITLDGKRHGEMFDSVVNVATPAEP
jgi:glyoxylase-like metal-dependent hydrolase (beta-lactamase superfamily II)